MKRGEVWLAGLDRRTGGRLFGLLQAEAEAMSLGVERDDLELERLALVDDVARMGHALVAKSLPGSDSVHKVSIIPRGIGALAIGNIKYQVERGLFEAMLKSRRRPRPARTTAAGPSARGWSSGCPSGKPTAGGGARARATAR